MVILFSVEKQQQMKLTISNCLSQTGNIPHMENKLKC